MNREFSAIARLPDKTSNAISTSKQQLPARVEGEAGLHEWADGGPVRSLDGPPVSQIHFGRRQARNGLSCPDVWRASVAAQRWSGNGDRAVVCDGSGAWCEDRGRRSEVTCCGETAGAPVASFTCIAEFIANAMRIATTDAHHFGTSARTVQQDQLSRVEVRLG
jgi:hypothetical protein